MKNKLIKISSSIVMSLLLFVSCNSESIQISLEDNGDTTTTTTTTTTTLSKAEVIAALQNYILVPGSASLGTDHFYIMKYEAKAWADDNTDDVVDTSELDQSDWNLAGQVLVRE